ncbi:MAG: lipopolysaccharide transport system ATP-binding protein [Blastocatellia bacterium]|jgi:lipopolysaccharide transport system ATP-binding protein|nr:lipopolysaccharide transport system ATP-binding protein [Blastocatellia bacterium]
MKPIIRVNNLSKRYRIGARRAPYSTLRETLAQRFRSSSKMFSSVDGNGERNLWALSDVSFEVMPGEVVGVIGRNGAGKSTLLKILSRITRPTEGHALLYGRASSLLEVGPGFHAELSGRENIYLNGAILGMKKTEIDRKFDEIVAFAEIENFIETPVKRYSSGMYVRLAFAVAAHLETEIIIIDEVLAVGDAQFQKKCLGKIGDVARSGRTVLFVSHNMAAVEHLCRRGLLLDQGRLAYAGTQTETIARYLATSNTGVEDLRERADRRGSGEVAVIRIEIKDTQGRPLETIASGQDVDIYLHYEAKQGFHHANVIAGLLVSTPLGVPVFLQHNRLTRDGWGDNLPARGAFVCRLRRLPLPASTYHLTYSLMRNEEYLDTLDNAFELNVVAGDFYGSGEVPPATHGCCLVDAEWRLESGTNVHQEAESEAVGGHH